MRPLKAVFPPLPNPAEAPEPGLLAKWPEDDRLCKKKGCCKKYKKKGKPCRSCPKF